MSAKNIVRFIVAKKLAGKEELLRAAEVKLSGVSLREAADMYGINRRSLRGFLSSLHRKADGSNIPIPVVEKFALRVVKVVLSITPELILPCVDRKRDGCAYFCRLCNTPLPPFYDNHNELENHIYAVHRDVVETYTRIVIDVLRLERRAVLSKIAYER